MILDYIGSDLYKDMVWSDYGRMRSKECPGSGWLIKLISKFRQR